MPLVIITAGIDLSVGSVAALSGVLGVMMMAQAGLPVALAILGGTLVGAICGLVNGLLVSVAGLNPFIATLGIVQRDVVDDALPGETARGLAVDERARDLVVAVRVVVEHPGCQPDG